MTEIVIGGDMADIPEGTYPATLIGLSTKTSKKFEGEFRVWTFKLANGSEVEGTSSMYTGPKSKPGRWIAALLGRKPAEGEAVNLVGRSCLVSVIENEKGWPTVDNVMKPMEPGAAFQEPTPMHEGMGDDDPRNAGTVIGELP